jgi:hypothetical protein
LTEWSVSVDPCTYVIESLKFWRKDWIIVYGEKAAGDERLSQELDKKLKSKGSNSKIMMDKEFNDSIDSKGSKNLILVGGYDTNTFTFRFNHTLPIQYIRPEKTATEHKEGGLCSLISCTVYQGKGHSTIEAIPNPYDENQQKGTIMIVAFGIHRTDTQMAVNKLRELIDGKEPRLSEILYDDKKSPAVIIYEKDGNLNFVN